MIFPTPYPSRAHHQFLREFQKTEQGEFIKINLVPTENKIKKTIEKIRGILLIKKGIRQRHATQFIVWRLFAVNGTPRLPSRKIRNQQTKK